MIVDGLLNSLRFVEEHIADCTATHVEPVFLWNNLQDVVDDWLDFIAVELDIGFNPLWRAFARLPRADTIQGIEQSVVDRRLSARRTAYTRLPGEPIEDLLLQYVSEEKI